MTRFLNTSLLVLVILNIYACRKKGELPAYTQFAENALQDPVQTATEQLPFTVRLKNQIHHVKPLYNYSISGMVVSCGFSKNMAKHRSDNLNIMDVGIIWGTNLNPAVYKKIEFYNNGVWLHAKTKNKDVWKHLDQGRLSNNHLLSNDPQLSKRIKAIKRGDVVSIEGYLVSYSGRGSSVERTDSGGGACETVWVDEFEILQDGTGHWHRLYHYNLYGLATLLALRIALFLCTTPSGYRS